MSGTRVGAGGAVELDGRRYEAVILDFDGVVVESVRIKGDAFVEVFKDHPEHAAAIEAFHYANGGMTRFKKFQHIYANLLHQPLSPELERRLGEHFSEIVFEKLIACPYVPGALGFIERCGGTVPLYVVSATPQGELREIVEARGLGRHFQEVLGAPIGKQELCAQLLQRHALRPDQVFYVGDARADWDAASSLGIDFVFRLPAGEPNWAAGLPVLRVIPDFTALPATVAQGRT